MRLTYREAVAQGGASASTIAFERDQLYCGTFDPERVEVVGWEYSANGWDGPHFSPEPITHKVAWKRPRFAERFSGDEIASR